jgi:nicotinamidase/pyrazinamidase
VDRRLAEEVCVRATVVDALNTGLNSVLIADGTRPVTKDGSDKAPREMLGD